MIVVFSVIMFLILATALTSLWVEMDNPYKEWGEEND